MITTTSVFPSELRFVEHFTVAASAADVWSVLADYSYDPSWRRAVLSMRHHPPGTVTNDTVTTERMRLLGATLTTVGSIHDVEPGHRFRWHSTAGAPARGERGVSAVTTGLAVIDLELIVSPRGAERMLTPLLKVVLRRRLSAEALALRRLVEDDVAVAAAVRSRDSRAATHPHPHFRPTHPELKELKW